ncbi:putative protein (DUF2233) [Abditibacterium utsteinense]|uniref:Phosphodiester glycosidase domain-containing protein n=1 Tax=Abditibacterium utsteinense TaxID=1960156 RepID=A0A2S8SQE3_9BACT|nr:phosphodiester glycosidase family protein [Abditibacterium utsteinense]PQV63012.1 putative protein (DUF2233) [Abditibacterium utsteinense]
MRFSRHRSIFTLLAVAGLLCGGGVLFSRLRAQERREETQIAPGITLLSVSTQTPSGPLRFWLVRAQKMVWQLGLQVADPQNIAGKRSVRDMAGTSGATVAINGGFFAYDGAAVGAVKVGGEWQRLPWKSRTALMWNNDTAQIAPLAGRCELSLTLQNGTTPIHDAALNGFSLPGTHTNLNDGFAVLMPRFGVKYKRKLGDEIAEFSDGQRILRAQDELPGEISIPANGFLLVARGQAALTLRQVRTARWKVKLGAPQFDKFPNILGAGPRLIENSFVKTTEIAEEFRPDVVARGPRTAVGFDQNGNTLFLVADGRQAASVGLTIPETAQLFQSLGATEAINLDGGSSTQLVIGGELINAPSGYDPVNPLRPREVRVINALILKAKSSS